MMLQFVTIALAGFDNSITITRGWDVSANPLQQTVPVYPTFIVLGFVLIAVYFIIFMKINRQFKDENKNE